MIMERFDLPSEVETPYLLTACNHNNIKSNCFTLSNASNKIHFEFDAPFLREKLFIGSQYGFVAVLDQYSEASLFNPLTGEIISLPSITTVQRVRPCRSANGNLESYFYRVCITNPESPFERYTFENFRDVILFEKIVVSSNPSISSSGFVVAALIDSSLAIAMPGKGRWNYLLERECTCYMDIMFCQNGTLICLTYEGAIHEIKFKNDDFFIKEVSAPFIKDNPQKIYLSENCVGNMYLIKRKLDSDDLDATYTTEVKVYRYNEEGNTWDQVKSLDGEAFFVGTNAAFSVKKEDVRGELKPDTIYFTDDWWLVACDEIKHSPRDICAYNLTDDSMELCCPSEHRQCTWPFPIWIGLRNMNGLFSK